jgi:hypothetical protein
MSICGASAQVEGYNIPCWSLIDKAAAECNEAEVLIMGAEADSKWGL